MKKVLYLFLALLLPGLIFVFLKYAGKNEFTVPIFYDQGVKLPEGCGFGPLDSAKDFSIAGSDPFTVSPKLRAMWEMNHEVNVVVFSTAGLDFNKIKLAIDEEMGKDAVWLKETNSLTIDVSGLSIVKKCEFLVNDPFQSVLIDKEGRIRGYYDLRKRDEVDRLRVELKILLKKY